MIEIIIQKISLRLKLINPLDILDVMNLMDEAISITATIKMAGITNIIIIEDSVSHGQNADIINAGSGHK